MRILFIIMVALLACQPGRAATRLGNLVFTPLSSPVPSRSHGYAVHWLRVTNESPNQRYRVRLVAPSRQYSSSGRDHITHIERTVTLEPRMEANVTLPSPPYPVRGARSVRVYVNGIDKGIVSLPSMGASFSSRIYGDGKATLLTTRAIDGQALDDTIWTKLFETPSTSTTSSRSRRPASRHSKNYEIIRSELELGEWHDDWLTYSCYDAIVMAAREWPSMPDGVAEALQTYVQLGGILVVAGADNAWRLPWDGRESTPRKGMRLIYSGFGQVLCCEQEQLETLADRDLRHLLTLARKTLEPWQQHVTMATATKQFAIVDSITLPIRGMLLIMLCFAIVIGPVMLIVLGRLNKRIWLLWIVPAVSLLTCSAVVIYSLVSEGTTPTVRTEGVTLLNQATHKAVTLGAIGIYCPLTPGQGLHFDRNTEVSPYITRHHNSGGQGRHINWTRDQHFSRGWVMARVPSYFLVRKPEIRRERIEILAEDGELRVLNGLGAEIEQLWVRRRGNDWYRLTDKLASGARGVLMQDTTHASEESRADARRSIYEGNHWPEQFGTVADHVETLLDEQSYLAVLNGSPFITDGLRGHAAHRTERSIVIGALQNARWGSSE